VEAEVLVQRHRVDGGVDATTGEQSRQRAREPQGPTDLREVQGLDAESVTTEQDTSAAGLHDGEREHADEVRHHVVAPAVVAGEDHLGVAGGVERVPGIRQLPAQLRVVVDATVERDHGAEVRPGQRLRRPFGEVDHLQATMSQRHPALGPHPRSVGTTGGHRLGHPGHDGCVGSAPVVADLAAESAHLVAVTPFLVRERSDAPSAGGSMLAYLDRVAVNHGNSRSAHPRAPNGTKTRCAVALGHRHDPEGDDMKMRNKVIVTAVVAALGFGLVGTAPAAAAPNERGACVQAGIGTLKSLGLLQAAAKQQVNYALIDENGPGIPELGLPGGLIAADLGDEAFLSLGAVVKLHTSNPELFAWC